MPHSHRTTLTRLACLLGLTASLTAHAQNAPALSADTTLAPVRVEADADDPRVPLTSTATKTQTPPRYVPQAIDTVKIDQVQSYGIKSLGEVLTGLPNVSSKQEARFDSVYIRGFDATYDTYLDGIRDDTPYVRDFHNVERIDVLKGPAAVLYGRGSQGGIINRVSKKPERDLGSSVQLGLGRWHARSLYGDFSANVGDTASVRLNVGEERSKSYRHRTNNQSQRQLFAPSLSWNITPDTHWLLQYEQGRYDRPLDQGIPSVRGRPAKVAWDANYGDPKDDVYDRISIVRSHLTHAITPDWTLRHSVAFFRLHNAFMNTYFSKSNYDSYTDPVKRARWGREMRTRNLINTVELEGVFHTAGIEHRTLLGVEYARQQRTPTHYGFPAAPDQILGNPDPSLQYAGAMPVANDQRHVANSLGLYLQDQIKFDEQWQVLLGLRHDSYDIKSRSDPNGNKAAREHARRRSHDLSPRLGVVWTPLPAHSVYGSLSKTFAPVGGGLFGIDTSPGNNGNRLPPEHTRQAEVGVKSDWLGGRLSSTLALYHLELYNKRYTDPNDPTRVVMRGKQRSRGVELSVAGRVTGNWYVRGGVGLQKAEILRDETGSAGKLSDNAPRRSGSLFVTWKPAQGWYAETGVTLVSARIGGRGSETTLPGYGRWDALFGYRTQQWDWTVSIVNLTDKLHYASVAHSGETWFGERRQLMSTLQYRF